MNDIDSLAEPLITDLTALRYAAQAQADAYARMSELGYGIGGLAVRHPGMAQSMHDWSDSSDNEHADTALALLDIIDNVLTLHEGTPYWINEEMNCEGEPDGYVCLECSPPAVEDDIAEWDFVPDDGAAVAWPCPTRLLITEASTPQPQDRPAGVEE